MSSLLGGGSMHDYQHAAKVFRSNGFQNAPKYKYLYHVNFNMYGGSSGLGFNPKLLSYLVKNIELPKFEVTLNELNQYNKKVINQTKIKYNPITIKLHDDNSDTVRNFWSSYYLYYFGDGQYPTSNSAYDSDLYVSRTAGQWGLNNYNSGDPYTYKFLSSIDIYSFHSGQASKITLINPIISNFSHDSHDYSENSSLMEATLTIHYTAVKYAKGYAKGTPGFADFQWYDQTVSNLGGSYSGMVMDSGTGNIINPTEYFNDAATPLNNREVQVAQQLVSQPTVVPGISQTDLSVLTQQAQKAVNPNDQFSFQTIDVTNPSYDQNTVNNINRVLNSTTNGATVNSVAENATTFADNTWQRNLLNRGFTLDQVNSASGWIDQATVSGAISDTSNLQNYAQTYIQNSEALNPIYPVNYTAPATATSLNFTNPGSSVQPVYDSTDWKTNLAALGYTTSDINQADAHISKLRFQPGANITSIAQQYIELSKQTSSVV